MRTKIARTTSARAAELVILSSILAAGFIFMSNIGQGATQTSPAVAVAPQASPKILDGDFDHSGYVTYIDLRVGGMFMPGPGNTPGASQHEDYVAATGPMGPFGAGLPPHTWTPRMGAMFNEQVGHTPAASQNLNYDPVAGADGPFG
jgi:hypothetical protein